MTKQWRTLVPAVFLLASGLVQAAEAPPADYPALGREVVDLVKDRFFDPDRATRWAAENGGYAARISDAAAFRRETQRRLAALGASHTAYYTPGEDTGYWDLLSIFAPVLKRPAERESLGAAFAEREEGWFVARVFAGGPAEAAGLRRGDRVATADGEPFHPVRSLAGKAGRPVILEVQDQPGSLLRKVAATPQRVDPAAEWLEAQRAGSRIVEKDGRRVAYVPIWSCAGDVYRQALADSLAGDLAPAEALVIDFRGGWGGCNPQLVALFDPAVPDLQRIPRDGGGSVWNPSWRKPLVVLIDGGSRSGKELVSRALQRHGRAVLVGERTAGAVLAGQPFLLSDGSLMFLAVEDVRVDGERLEETGVAPDVPVPSDLRYAAGRDPQLDRALGVAAGALSAPARTPL